MPWNREIHFEDPSWYACLSYPGYYIALPTLNNELWLSFALCQQRPEDMHIYKEDIERRKAGKNIRNINQRIHNQNVHILKYGLME